MKTRDRQQLSHTVVTVITVWTRALMGTLRWQQGKLILSFAHLFVRSRSSCTRTHLYFSLPLIRRLMQTLEILYTWFIVIHSHLAIHAPSSVLYFLLWQLIYTHAERPIQHATWIPAVSHWRNTTKARKKEKIYEIEKIRRHYVI